MRAPNPRSLAAPFLPKSFWHCQSPCWRHVLSQIENRNSNRKILSAAGPQLLAELFLRRKYHECAGTQCRGWAHNQIRVQGEPAYTHCCPRVGAFPTRHERQECLPLCQLALCMFEPQLATTFCVW